MTAQLRELKIFRSPDQESRTGVMYEIRLGGEPLYSEGDYMAVRHGYAMLLTLKERGFLNFDFQPFFDAKDAPAVFEDRGR